MNFVVQRIENLHARYGDDYRDQNRARALRATRIALYVWDFPSARVWLVLCSRIQGNIIMWRTPYFYLMRSHVTTAFSTVMIDR